MRKNFRKLYLLLIPVILAIILSITLQSTVLQNKDQYTAWLTSFGPWFILVYVVIQTVGIIIAPIGGFFIQIGLFALLPPIQALLLIYTVTTPAFFINYYLAKKYGRPLVKRLVGEHSLETVDSYAKEIGPLMLLIAKLFQGGIFDYVSYAAGLAAVRPIHFFLINVFGGAPAIALTYFILVSVENFALAVVFLMAISYILFGLSLLLLYIRKKNTENAKSR